MVLSITGCATPGPNHTYVASDSPAPVLDLSTDQPTVAVPSYLNGANSLYGIAYDPFTDHLFLRLSPGNLIRVIDRPARKIKRSFMVEGLPVGQGDLAIRSSDRHLFFAHPNLPALVESTLYGKFVRTLTLASLARPPDGVAYDQKNDRLFILASGDPVQVFTYDLTGKQIAGITLDRDVLMNSLAYDSVAGEFYLLLSESPVVGVFNGQGHWQRSIPLPTTAPTGDFIDVGPRSWLRLF